MSKKGKDPDNLPSSGLIKWTERPLPKKATTPEEITKALREWADAHSLEAKLELTRREVANAEKLALSIYAKHGLPSINGAYRRRPGGKWEAVSLAAEPGGKWERVPGVVWEAPYEHCHLEKVPEKDFPLEHEVRRAGELLGFTGDAFRLLKSAEESPSWDTVQAMSIGMRLMQAAYVWREEWVLNKYIVPARRAQEGSSKGADRLRLKSEPILNTARSFIAKNPNTTQGACVSHVELVLGRSGRHVERKVSALFEWRTLATGKKEKRPKPQ